MSNYGLWIIDKVINNLEIDTSTPEYYYKRLLKLKQIDIKQVLDDFKHNITYDELASKNNCTVEMIRRLIRNHISEDERKQLGIIKNIHHEKMKSIVQLDLNGNYIATYRSCLAAANAINGDAKRILNICKHKPSYKTTKEYIFKFEDEYNNGGGG